MRQARDSCASPQMEDLLVTAHRVADTDATVLILGERARQGRCSRRRSIR